MGKGWTGAWVFASWVIVGVVGFLVLKADLEDCGPAFYYRYQSGQNETGGQQAAPKGTQGAGLSHGQQESPHSREVRDPPGYEFCSLKLSDLLVLLGAYLTVGVGLAQVVYLSGTLDATASNAAAAKLSAESIRRIERSYVFVKVTPTTASKPDMLLSQTKSGISLIFANRGKTPAVVKGLRYAFMPSVVIPETLPKEANKKQLSSAWVIAAGFSVPYPLVAKLDANEADLIVQGKKTLYLAGVFFYEDVFGEPRETGFCWHYIPEGHRFKPVHVTKLNYNT